MSHDYEDGEDEGRSNRSSVSAVKLSGLDWLLAAGATALMFIGLSVFSFVGMSPDGWNDAAVAAGLRPPAEIFPGFFRVLARVCYLGEVSTGNALMPILGRICGGLTAGFAFLFFRSLIAQLVRLRLRYAERRFTIQRLAAFAGSIFFMCSDPMWRMGQVFTAAGLVMMLVVVALFLFMQFLLSGKLLPAMAALFLCGALAAETPFGFVLVLVCWYGYLRAYKSGSLSDDCPLLDRGAGQSARWMLSFVWLVGIIVGIGVNCLSFVQMRGLEASGKVIGDMPLMYLQQWWYGFIGSATPLGWALALGICVMTFTVSLLMLPRASDEERLLPYYVGTLSCFMGVLAFAQLAMLSPLWFWTWSAATKVNSPLFLQLLVLMAAGTVVGSLMVFGVESSCRDCSRLRRNGSSGLSMNGRFAIFVAAVVLMAAGELPGRVQRTTRVMLGIIDDYAREVVAECGPDVHWIFGDGSFDSRYELLAAEQKRELYALSLMDGSSTYYQYLRLRGKVDEDDRASLGINAATGLRSWLLEKPARLKECAVQQGFELWKRQGMELPPCSGVLARPQGMDEAARLKGVENAKGLAQRILDVYKKGGIPKSAGEKFSELFTFVQWRISRVARMRAERADRALDVATAEADTKISEYLDDRNASLQKILADMEHARTTTLRQVTPREGLQLALSRADFALAAGYARPILKTIKDDPDANFGLAMSYVVQKQWSRAEEHLKIFVAKRPKEISGWNNLAMICLKQNRLTEAEAHAKKALELAPESAEIKDTLKQIEAARSAAAAPAESEKKKPSKQGAK